MVHIKCYVYISYYDHTEFGAFCTQQIVLCYNIQFHTGNLITSCTYAARGKAIVLSFACLSLA